MLVVLILSATHLVLGPRLEDGGGMGGGGGGGGTGASGGYG